MPLAVFLPARRKDYVFSWRGRGHEAGRETIVLDYRMRYDEAPTIEWEESCVPLPDGLLVRDATGLARLVPAD